MPGFRVSSLEPGTFLGFRRERGGPGVRNALLVLNLAGLTEPSARAVAAGLAGSVLVSMPHGLAISGRGEKPVNNTLEALARHPNAGAVLLLGADTRKTETFEAALADVGKPLRVVTMESAGRDALAFRMAAMREGAQLISLISTQRREAFPFSALRLALECGLSDPTSGLAANPLLGRVTDRLVAAGGAAVFGETTEWLGSEDGLAARACRRIAAEIYNAVERRERLAKVCGIDLLFNNPGRANIEAGLSTIEDKAIGSVAKSGTAPVSAFLAYGDRHEEPGLAAMDGPSYTPESLTGLVAAGAQIALFTSGVGNSYTSALAPTIKVTGNGETAERLPEQFDFVCADLMERPDLIEMSADALVERILEVASGAQTFGEILGEGDEVVARFGETL
ncbi:MAG: UxaA family hydrolase [Pseudomonadota bacterium]